jgi:hypothetical protein
MATNAYQGRFVLLRIKAIIYKKSLAFCFPSKPRMLAQASLRNNTRLLMLLDSVSINLHHWQWEYTYLFILERGNLLHAKLISLKEERHIHYSILVFA